LIAQNQTGGLISFGGVSGSTVGGTCAFTATATYNGATYTSSSYGPYQVFEKGDLACNTATALPDPPVPGAGYFAVLPTGVTSVTDVGFAAGYRAANDKSDCTYELIGYTFTNNIKGGFSTDGAGNTLPNNAVSFVWDEVKRPDGVFTYTLTFDYEYASVSTGLPVKRTKFCKLDTDVLGKPIPTNCTLASKQFELKACLGTDLKASSIPGTDPACIAREEWVTVSPINCPAWTDTGTMEPPACIRATARIIDARDPPIIR
jgi:hypothetical protein